MLKLSTKNAAQAHAKECRSILTELTYALDHGMTGEGCDPNEITIHGYFERLQHAAWEGKNAVKDAVKPI